MAALNERESGAVAGASVIAGVVASPISLPPCQMSELARLLCTATPGSDRQSLEPINAAKLDFTLQGRDLCSKADLVAFGLASQRFGPTVGENAVTDIIRQAHLPQRSSSEIRHRALRIITNTGAVCVPIPIGPAPAAAPSNEEQHAVETVEAEDNDMEDEEGASCAQALSLTCTVVGCGTEFNGGRARDSLRNHMQNKHGWPKKNGRTVSICKYKDQPCKDGTHRCKYSSIWASNVMRHMVAQHGYVPVVRPRKAKKKGQNKSKTTSAQQAA